MAAAAVLLAAAVGALVPVGSGRFAALTAALALATGLVALAAGLLRLGCLANIISEPVLKSFIVGLSLAIIARRLPKLFGIQAGPGDFFQQLWHLVAHLRRHSGASPRC